MAERMLVTQALDERDLLVKKISDKINKAHFVDTIKNNEERVFENRISKEDFKKQAKSSYQQILDFIERYQKIDAAIVESNANHFVETSYGTYTVAAAISLRRRLKDSEIFDEDEDFEMNLYCKMNDEYQEKIQFIETKNKQLEQTAENMRLSILGKENKVKEDKPLGVVDAYVQENTVELVDPINILKKMELLKEKRNTLLRELDTQIKVSNATTLIEIV